MLLCLSSKETAMKDDCASAGVTPVPRGTVRYLGIEVGDAIEIAEKIDI